MQFERKPMVGWYDVKQLVSTGLKTVVSMVFGNYSDKREIQAFAEQEEPYDFSAREELWIDYISDLGDGFNPTYTLAQLMARDQLTIDGTNLKRGDLLIMGGDEVYPTPEKIEYKNRLQGPYNAAFPWKDDESAASKPRLFAIPGNHDWYDGLTNFIRLFCQGRALGNWLTSQKRSYFALKLPHSHWLIGIDIQLQGDIDEPQKAYFKRIAKNKFKPHDNVILCTAEPTWVYASLSGDHDADQRLRFFIRKILKGEDDNYYNGKNEHLHVTTILTGDLHHYSRYETTTNDQGQKTQLITAGGGGAFMHPTHMLKKTIGQGTGEKATLKDIFPSRKQSIQLTWRNLVFPFYNWSMCLFLGIFHVLTSWFLQSTTENPYGNSFMETVSGMKVTIQNLDNYLQILVDSIKHSPSVLILNLLLFGGILLFTDTKTGKRRWNYIAGLSHSLLQLANLFICIWLFSRWNLYHHSLPVDNFVQILLFTLEMVVIGGSLSGFIFGFYLLISSLVFKSHPTEASSSYRHEGYKNFLRIHLSKEKLIIYPIGLKTVSRDWKNVGTEDKPAFEGSPVTYALIEDKPIEINHTP